jgi:hypothetical protein
MVSPRGARASDCVSLSDTTAPILDSSSPWGRSEFRFVEPDVRIGRLGINCGNLGGATPTVRYQAVESAHIGQYR